MTKNVKMSNTITREIIIQRFFDPPAFFTIAFVVCVSLPTLSFAVSRSTSNLFSMLFWWSISSLIPRLNCPNRRTDPPKASRLSSCSFIRRSYWRLWSPLSSSSYSPVGKLLYFWAILISAQLYYRRQQLLT